MGQHGFARDMDFTLESADEQSITFCLTSNEETLQKYPFPFELRITHTLNGHTLKVTWEVRNPSLAPMYFSIGGHPAFNVPADREHHRNDYYVQFKGSDTYSYILIDPEEEAANPDQPHLLETDDGILPVTDHLFDNDALIFDNGQVQQASILYPDRTPYVTLSCKGFPSFGLWSKPHSDAPYICLEPWIGRVDNIGFDGELPDKYGEMELAGGDVFTASYTIEVH
jgi:galactose mutarotase-like enzyme